jgi:glutamine cyclotransferase
MRARVMISKLILCFVAAAAAGNAAAQTDYTYEVVHAYPHDAQAFTQGLVFVDGHLYESTGLNGKSSLRMEDLETGSILKFQDVPSEYFAEGLTNWGSTLIQLTWQNHLALVYDRSTFRFLHSIPYPWDGWGLTQDGKSLILSDGSATLHEIRRVTVKARGVAVKYLNELEWVNGEIYANVWHTARIARISPSTGKVEGWIDLSGLLAENQRSDQEAVLNGIAWDGASGRLFVTGKRWPKVFEIKVVPRRMKK